MKRDYQKLIQKLELLRKKDPQCKVMNARSHKYQLTPQLEESTLQAYEEKWGYTLPEEYRDFLKEVGGSGAGPYPLYPLELEGEPDPIKKQKRLEPFTYPRTPEEIQAAMNRYDNLTDEAYDAETYSGVLIVANGGCAFDDMIVLNGPERGHMWQDTGIGHLVPHAPKDSMLVDETGQKFVFDPQNKENENYQNLRNHMLGDYNLSRRMGFYDWYDQWLDYYLEWADKLV